MKKTLKTVMAALTAVTMLTGTIGTTVFAAETGTAAAVSSEASVPYDGVFSQGATYHFISNGETLIVDGEGSFTREEFAAVAEKLNPKIVALGDNVSVCDEWIREGLVLPSTYRVITHNKSKALDDIRAFKWRRIEELEACGKGSKSLKHCVSLTYAVFDLPDHMTVDFYKWFDYSDGIVAAGKRMEEYLMKKKISERIARKVAGCYMIGLKLRMNYFENLDKFLTTDIACPDGTEVNEAVTNWWLATGRRIAEIEQAFFDEDYDALHYTELGQYYDEHDMAFDDSKEFQLTYMSGGLAHMIQSGTPASSMTGSNFKDEDAKKLKAEWDAKRQAETALEPVKIQSAEKVKGDINGDGAFTVADVVKLQKALAASTATLDMDINGDGKVNVFDLVAAKQMLAEYISTADAQN